MITSAEGHKEWVQLYSKIHQYIHRYHHTGSTAIVGQGQDFDVVLMCKQPIHQSVFWLDTVNAVPCTLEDYPDAVMQAWRVENINLILVDQAAHYNAWATGLAVCSHLYSEYGITKKELRASVFQSIRDGATATLLGDLL